MGFYRGGISVEGGQINGHVTTERNGVIIGQEKLMNYF